LAFIKPCIFFCNTINSFFSFFFLSPTRFKCSFMYHEPRALLGFVAPFIFFALLRVLLALCFAPSLWPMIPLRSSPLLMTHKTLLALITFTLGTTLVALWLLRSWKGPRTFRSSTETCQMLSSARTN
jgi:hypothetical protein